MKTNRFNTPIWAEPATWDKPPTADQIAATGRALPSGPHKLTSKQQRAWFGGVVFPGPVEWDGKAFVSGGTRLTPQQVAKRVQGDH